MEAEKRKHGRKSSSSDGDDDDSSGSDDEEGSDDDVSGFKESMLKALQDSSGKPTQQSRTSGSDTDGKHRPKSRTIEDLAVFRSDDSESGQSSDSDDDEEHAKLIAGFHGNRDEDDDDDDELFTVKTDVFGLKDKTKVSVNSLILRE